jgi:hypothetical protein
MYLWYYRGKFGGCWQIPTQKNVSGSKLCQHDRGILAKCANIWLSGQHVADMSATFSAKMLLRQVEKQREETKEATKIQDKQQQQHQGEEDDQQIPGGMKSNQKMKNQCSPKAARQSPKVADHQRFLEKSQKGKTEMTEDARRSAH